MGYKYINKLLWLLKVNISFQILNFSAKQLQILQSEKPKMSLFKRLIYPFLCSRCSAVSMMPMHFVNSTDLFQVENFVVQINNNK